MRIVCGIWAQWCRRFCGTSKSMVRPVLMYKLTRHSFLVRDAQEDLAGTRSKR
jgi:hypothetical protein